MADMKISALPAAAALAGGEAIPAVQSGGNVRLTPAQLAAYVLGGAAGIEMVQDIVGALIAAGSGIVATYNDPGNVLTISTATKGNVATADPTAASDTTAGYVAGSGWLNTATGVRWVCLDASAGAATWMPSSAMDHPGYVSGRTYGVQRGTGVATGAAPADTLLAVPLYIAQRVTIASLGLRIVTAAAGSVRLALYANAGGTPGAKLAEVASAGSTGTVATLQLALGANLTLAPGIYWIAALFSAAPTCTNISAADQFVGSLIGTVVPQDAYSTSAAVVAISAANPYAGGMPAAFPTTGLTFRGTATPILGFTVA